MMIYYTIITKESNLALRRRSQQFSESEEYLDTESESIYARY